jgi:hypothetical protein
MTTTERPPIADEDEYQQVLADVLRRLDELEKNLADRLDVRTSEIIESIRGYSPHKLRDFEQERDHGIVYAEPLDIDL